MLGGISGFGGTIILSVPGRIALARTMRGKFLAVRERTHRPRSRPYTAGGCGESYGEMGEMPYTCNLSDMVVGYDVLRSR